MALPRSSIPSASNSHGSRHMPIDLTDDSPPKKSRSKRGLPDGFDDKKASEPRKSQKTGPSPRKAKPISEDEEKRLRRWRNTAPSAYYKVRERALTQRMVVLDRQRDESHAGHPRETVRMAGTTGNIYTIVIDKIPSCDCPHALEGNQCKHVVYVLSRVLRAPHNLEYQLAFISSELRTIFSRAPPLPTKQADQSEKDGNRKPLEGECPICCEDFEPRDMKEQTVYCKASCGNNIHKLCFDRWARTKAGGDITCPFCRARWVGDAISIPTGAVRGRLNAEGYVNVADQLGLPTSRDHSSYHGHWIRNWRRGLF